MVNVDFDAPKENMAMYQKTDKVRSNIINKKVTFSIWFEKFLNLYACIFATMQNPQITIRNNVYNQMYAINMIK